MNYLGDFMLNKINTIFSMGVNKDLLLQNEEMYDDYFNVLLANYQDERFEQKFFKDTFQKLIDLCELKRKYQDQLANYSDTLSSTLKQAGDLIQKISFLLQQS